MNYGMKNMTKKLIKRLLREQLIDGQNMSKSTQNLCDIMTISSYDEAISLVHESLKQFDEKTKTEIMQKIHVPLENLRQEQLKINQEIESENMSGDCVPDEADTYWHQIQSTICELGPAFQ